VSYYIGVAPPGLLREVSWIVKIWFLFYSFAWTSCCVLEVLDFLMGYESYLRKQPILVSDSIYRFVTGLSLRLRADISKDTAHERIQHLYLINFDGPTQIIHGSKFLFIFFKFWTFFTFIFLNLNNSTHTTSELNCRFLF
jgi:hypothetical protein